MGCVWRGLCHMGHVYMCDIVCVCVHENMYNTYTCRYIQYIHMYVCIIHVSTSHKCMYSVLQQSLTHVLSLHTSGLGVFQS